MSALIACLLWHPWTVSVDCLATCEATEFQISIWNLWIINSFGQNTALLTGNSGIEQLLELIGIQTRLCVWLTKKTHAEACLLGPFEEKKCNSMHGCPSSHHILAVDAMCMQGLYRGYFLPGLLCLQAFYFHKWKNNLFDSTVLFLSFLSFFCFYTDIVS